MNTMQCGPQWIAGAISTEHSENGVRPWRLPVHQLSLYDPGLAEDAGVPAGVRVAFATDSPFIALQVRAIDKERQFDLVIGAQLRSTALLPPGEEIITFDLPAGLIQAEIYLSNRYPVEVLAISIAGGSVIEPVPKGRPRWVVYGSSITKGGAAFSPAQTWPSIVARRKGWDLTCLGFGGQCHLEPMMAKLIRDWPADVISLCLGINIYGAKSLNLRTFRSAVIGMISIIREKHPNTPLFVMSPIYAPDRETTENPAGLTLVQIRDEIREAVDIMKAYGDEWIFYFHGLDIFGSEDAAYLSDGVHPSAEGYKLLGERYLNYLDERGLAGDPA
ncbi:SGNH/GDSL hydrolase family protein [Paenibacillus koleovorans]|uniref:SGNH/GDSL hydrolase family protein n=1 Tax=Paenibacillus koleovorans TaxID=121608 RepID=UPI000FDA01B0|nr:SGNH/GDSL hydrolase family protein [Paenibacillus koleovorans]